MEIFNYKNFLTAPVEFQATTTSSFIKRADSVEMRLSGKTAGESQYVRGKKKLSVNYKEGDDFWVYETLALPDNFYSQQNGSMRLISIWHNVEFGRLGLWIDSTQKPRLQIERKDKKTLSALWTGAARQIPTGKHQYALHIILGSLIELFVDGVSMAQVHGDNMPYAGYEANQILFFFDGANANTKPFTAIGYEMGADVKAPFAVADPCADLEFRLAVATVARKTKDAAEAEAEKAHTLARMQADAARLLEAKALAALNDCKGF